MRRLSPKRQACIYLDMMANLTEFSLAESIAVLTRTPAALNAMLRGMPDIWVRRNERKDTWNALDIVGHLIVGERTDWLPRVRIIMENGEARPFDAFDRFAQSKETQDKSVEIDPLLGDFARLRTENLTALRAMNLRPELGPARKAPRAGSSNAVGTYGHLGRARPYPSASTIPRDGPPVS
jgi:hypothetical protein